MWKLQFGWWQKRRKYVCYSEWKYWLSLPLLCLWNLYADFLKYLSGMKKSEYCSLRADPVYVTVHRLSVACFSLHRWLMSNIFRLDNSCVSSGLLIGSVTFPYSTPSLPVPHSAGPNSWDLNYRYRQATSCGEWPLWVACNGHSRILGYTLYSRHLSHFQFSVAVWVMHWIYSMGYGIVLFLF